MKALRALNSIVAAFTGVMLGIMTVLVLLQVLFRYVISVPFPESQELAVYAMVYVVTFGSSVAVFNHTHVCVSFVSDMAPPALRFLMRVCTCVAMVIFFGLLVKYGFDLAARSMMQRGTATGIPVGYVVAAIPVSSIICCIYSIGQFIEEVQKFRHGEYAAKPAAKE